MYINGIAAPELIKALNHFLAWTLTVRQSKISSIVNWNVDDCPFYSFESSSLLEESSSSLKDDSHHLILRKNLTVDLEW